MKQNSTLIALFALIVNEIGNKIGTSKKHPSIILINQMKIPFSLVCLVRKILRILLVACVQTRLAAQGAKT